VGEPGDPSAALPAKLAELLPDPWFPFAGDLVVKPLQAPTLLEPGGGTAQL
jgi:hypothetical protein